MRRRSRSWRRHHKHRMRLKAYKVVGYTFPEATRKFRWTQARKRADHLRTCSCAMCYSKSSGIGKKRDLTLNEKRAIKSLQEGVLEHETLEVQTERYDMTREKLICEILRFWTKDQDRADRIDEKSYTHASCGYEEAQSYVKGLLGYSVESLEYILKEYQNGES